MKKAKSTLLKPSWRKVLADLSADKSRTALVVASIAVGIFAIGTIVTMFAIFGGDIETSYAAAQPSNIEVITDPFDDDLIKAVERIPGVANAEGRHVVNVRSGTDGEDWRPLEVMAAKDYPSSEINLLNPVAGSMFPNDRELVVRQDMMNPTGLVLGDEAFIQLADGTVRTMPIVGVVGDQSAAGNFAGAPRAYATQETAVWLGGHDQYNRLYVQAENGEDEATIEALALLVEDKIERQGGNIYRTNTNLTTEHPMAATALAILGVLAALGLLIMLLSSSLIINTLNALLSQHRRQIGVMKLVGARSSHISKMYIALILCYGVIALAISVPLGMMAGYGLSVMMGQFMSVNIQGFRVVPMAIILQVILAFGVPLIAGYFPVRKGSKMTVRRAISEENPVEQGSGTGLLDKLGLWFKWLSRPLLLSIRNTFRRKGRLLLTLFTLSVAGAIFIGVFNVRHSLGEFTNLIASHFMADVTVTLNESYRTAQVEQVVFQVDGVEYVEGWGQVGGEIVNEADNILSNVSIIAPPNDSQLVDTELLAGRWLHPDDENVLIIADSVWDIYPDLAVGDSILVKLPGKRAESWEVVGIFQFLDMLGDTMAYANKDAIARMTNSIGKSSSYRLELDIDTLERQDEVSTVLEQTLLDQGYKVGNVESGIFTQQQQGMALNILVVFLLSMAILTAIVGSIGLWGTMGMNVLERTREIGVMRAIGAVDSEIIKSVIVEGLMIGLISWLIATVLSYPISSVLLNIMSQQMASQSMPLEINWQGFVIWLVVVVILSAVSSIMPARNASRLTIREVLAYE